jgi:hypothetical protein
MQVELPASSYIGVSLPIFGMLNRPKRTVASAYRKETYLTTSFSSRSTVSLLRLSATTFYIYMRMIKTFYLPILNKFHQLASVDSHDLMILRQDRSRNVYLLGSQQWNQSIPRTIRKNLYFEPLTDSIPFGRAVCTGKSFFPTSRCRQAVAL